jgi:hypothetical protein
MKGSCVWLRAATVAGTVAVFSIAAPAAAETQVSARYGYWSVLEGTTNQGSRVCGVASMGSAPEKRYLAVRFFPDEGYLEVQVAKDTWAIPSGTKVPLEIEFNGYPGAWRSQSGGNGDGRYIYQRFNSDAAVNFLREFRGASSGVIRFGGNESAWAMNLTGSSAAVGAMIDCIRRARGGTAQPYATQPSEPTLSYTPSAKPPSTVPPVTTSRERRT